MIPWEWIPASLSAMVEGTLRGLLGMAQFIAKWQEMGNRQGL